MLKSHVTSKRYVIGSDVTTHRLQCLQFSIVRFNITCSTIILKSFYFSNLLPFEVCGYCLSLYFKIYFIVVFVISYIYFISVLFTMALLPGFVKGQSDNLPKLDSFAVFSFLGNNPNFMGSEIRGFKAQRYVYIRLHLLFYLCNVDCKTLTSVVLYINLKVRYCLCILLN